MNRKIIKPTPFGSVGIIWTAIGDNPKIVRIFLTTPDLPAEERVFKFYPNSLASSCAEIEATATGIMKMLNGRNISFSLELADMSLCSDFKKRVLRAEHQIPRGSISTYRLIATYLGKPNGARAVGNALANNPFPLIVPCHRAIRSDGNLGGYQGGIDMKRALLEREGIRFDNAGRVKSNRFHYEI